ncbi:Transmembrane component MtsC of energizing module of methionine-regulated ECF transporter [Dehalobacter sp. UNSWDHB]|uniref:energy-coupling factor transporter transmembrane component T family protein n=1 Tax=Dehalobacter sp. UNSWDHB TaxID=1339256 RepID=UPI0003879230|nr:CbiQ family ECF transporter T component [Dehalobacter sp. UNSWDHB]EQB22227.1 Transmembrane component MtsC of energizing module of methionine-regulated ECF transporter [Dehalobacter sp. UNSWDHB]
MAFIEKIDPRTKLVWCLTLILTALLSQNLILEMGIIALVILADCIFTNHLKKYKILLPVMLLVASQILVIQLLFCQDGDLLWKWGILSVYTGAIPAAALGISRTAAVTLAAVQFMTWTSATDAALMLIAWGVPYRYAMLVVMTKRFFPLMQKEYLAISESQSVRGYPSEGIKNRIKNLPLTFMPLLYRTVRHTSDIALAMELKGYGRSKQRTFGKQLHLKSWEMISMMVLVLFFITVNLVP